MTLHKNIPLEIFGEHGNKRVFVEERRKDEALSAVDHITLQIHRLAFCIHNHTVKKRNHTRSRTRAANMNSDIIPDSPPLAGAHNTQTSWL